LANRLDADQQALKILASATAYGIFVELNPQQHAREIERRGYGSDGPFTTPVRHDEQPGQFFHPLLGSLITGAARSCSR